MCFTIGLTLLALKKAVLDYQCTVGAPVWSAKASTYLQIALVLLTYLYMHLISISVESNAISG